MAILVAATLACAVALLAWGPVPVSSELHQHADRRPVAGLANGWNVLANLPLLAVGLWGLWVERRSRAPAWLRRSRATFHAAAVTGAVFSAAYHVAPADAPYLLAQASLAAAFLAITAAMLAERVHPAFASPAAMGLIGLIAGGATIWTVLLGGDLRPVLLAQLVPLLVAPTGVLTLPGQYTRSGDWLLLLALYAVARLLDLADAWLLQVSGFVAGHALMHVSLSLAALWVVYGSMRSAAGMVADAETQRRTSLHTAG